MESLLQIGSLLTIEWQQVGLTAWTAEDYRYALIRTGDNYRLFDRAQLVASGTREVCEQAARLRQPIEQKESHKQKEESE